MANVKLRKVVASPSGRQECLLPAGSALFDFFRGWRGSLFVICGICLVLIESGASAEATERPRRVLMLYSPGHNSFPFSTVISAFQTELAQQSKVTIEFHEVSVAGPQVPGGESDRTTIKYLQTLFGAHTPDLVVPCGGPAARFALRVRSQLYTSAPLLLLLVDARHLKTFTLDTNTTAIASQWAFPELIENVIRILPATTNVAVVIGGSRVEAGWKQEMQGVCAAFTNRLGFVWLTQYSLEEMRQKVGQLPPHTAIVYVSLFVDAADVPHEYGRVINVLHGAANAPMVGVFDEEIGLGIVGGPMWSLQKQGRESGRVAARILRGELPGEIRPPVLTNGAPVYDWRELRRWNISENRLPPGSIVKYRARTTWEQHRFWIITSLSGLLAEAALIAGLLLNLARRRRAECAMRDSEERMELAASAADLAMWEWDFASDKVWLDGRSRERLVKGEINNSDFRQFLRMIHPEDRDGVEQALAKALGGDGYYEHDHRRVLSDGKVRFIAARGRVEFDAEHKPVRMRGVSMDITARKLAEEQAKKAEAELQRSREELAHVSRVSTLGELAGSLAHELSQPLATIVANAEAAQVLMSGDLRSQKEVGDALTDIGKQGQRAAGIIAGIRGMLKKEPGKMAAQDLNVEVKMVIEMLRHDLASRGVKPVLRLDPELPAVNGYGVQLRQVVLNLVLNACDAMSDTPTGRRELTIESRRVTAGEVAVSVTDSGAGFPEEVLLHAFEPFRTTKAKGLGLGLAICRSIIMAHGGTLAAVNNSGNGATVRFILPAQSQTGI